MLELILTAINAKLAMLNKLANLYCLAERRPIDGGKTVPYAYRGGRDLQPINIDSGSAGYWRINGEGSDEYINDPYVAGQQRQVTWPLRFYAMAHRDSQFTASALADLIGSTITDADDDVAQLLDMEDVSITVSGRDLDTTALYGSEFDEFDLPYHLAFIALTVTVTIRGSASCFPDPCDIDTDILHSFNFCDSATRARLTDEQVDCLTAALCETPPTLCEQLADVLPADVVADVFDCLTPEAQAELLDSECVIPPCAKATAVLKNTANTTLSTTSIASGASQNITAPNATAVLKDTAGATLSTTAIPSNESADITAPDGVVSLNGTFYANVKSGGTLGVLATSVLPATITLGGTGLAAFAQQTLGCTESGYSSYVWHLVNSAYLNNVITLSGQNVNCYPTFDGTWTVYLMVTGAGSQVGYATTTFTVTNGLRPTVLINNTAPPGAAILAITQDAEWVRYHPTAANNVSHYQAARLTGGTTGGVVFRDTPISAFLRVGLSPGITYAGAINQESDPAWDWIMGAWLSGNNLVYVQDNGGVVSTTKYIYEGFWWRMDRATSGTIRLYRGTDIHNINTLTHTYSLTNVSDLYIRLYNQSIRSHFQLMYYGAAA